MLNLIGCDVLERLLFRIIKNNSNNKLQILARGILTVIPHHPTLLLNEAIVRNWVSVARILIIQSVKINNLYKQRHKSYEIVKNHVHIICAFKKE